MAFKVDKRGIKYVNCFDNHQSRRFIIYHPIRFWGDWVVTKFGIENFHHVDARIAKTDLWDDEDIAGRKRVFVEPTGSGSWSLDGLDEAIEFAKRIHAKYGPSLAELLCRQQKGE